MSENPLNRQIGGQHYKDNAVQPLEYVVENGLGFCEANVVKYTTRYRHKNGIEDLRKVEHYIQLHFEMVDREPLVFRIVRKVLCESWQYQVQPDDRVGMPPSEYITANGIEDEDAQHLIAGVCHWRNSRQGVHVIDIESSRRSSTSLWAVRTGLGLLPKRWASAYR